MLFLEGLAAEDPAQVSDEFKNRPTLREWQVEMMESFMLLSASRSYGFSSANPIPISEMVLMYSINGALAFMDLLEMIRIWRRMDDICLVFWAKERDEKANKKPLTVPAT